MFKIVTLTLVAFLALPSPSARLLSADEIKAKGMRRIRFHHSRHSLVEHADGENDPDRPANPGGDVLESIKEVHQKQWTQTIGNRTKSLAEGVPAMKRLANGFDEPGAQKYDHQIQQELNRLENDDFTSGIIFSRSVFA